MGVTYERYEGEGVVVSEARPATTPARRAIDAELWRWVRGTVGTTIAWE